MYLLFQIQTKLPNTGYTGIFNIFHFLSRLKFHDLGMLVVPHTKFSVPLTYRDDSLSSLLSGTSGSVSFHSIHLGVPYISPSKLNFCSHFLCVCYFFSIFTQMLVLLLEMYFYLPSSFLQISSFPLYKYLLFFSLWTFGEVL